MESKAQTANILVTRLVHLGALNGLEADTIIDALDGLERELTWRRRRDDWVNKSSSLHSWQKTEFMKYVSKTSSTDEGPT